MRAYREVTLPIIVKNKKSFMVAKVVIVSVIQNIPVYSTNLKYYNFKLHFPALLFAHYIITFAISPGR